MISTSMRKGKRNPRVTALVVAAVVVIVVLTVMPRWRRAASCVVTGGRWVVGTNDYVSRECRMKSKTAKKPCTGQLRDECDRAICDLNVKAPGGAMAGGGTCPAHWVKYFYNKDGDFYRVN